MTDDAMRGLATGNRNGKPAKRKQEILTPVVIREVCRLVWPDGIALGPAGNKESIMGADYQYLPTRGEDGLNLPWFPRSFINPPYDDLKKWLAYGMTQPAQQIWLVPNRTSRPWFREWRNQLNAFVELNPIAFHGYVNKAPFPLLLGYVGGSINSFLGATNYLGQQWVRRPGGLWASAPSL